MARVYLTVVLLLCVLAAPLFAAQYSLDGAWRAGLVVNGQRCVFALVMSAGQHYDEAVQCGPYRTWQRGTYKFSNGILFRRVEDFEPKRRWIQDTGYSGHYEHNATPPGGIFQVTFTSPNTMVWRDRNFGGTITYDRVQQ